MSAKIQGLDGLKKKYATFEFRNRSGSESRRINLTGGDSAQVQASSSARIQSQYFDQLPAFSDFEPIVPSIEDMIAAGLIDDGSAKADEDEDSGKTSKPAVVVDPAPAPKSK